MEKDEFPGGRFRVEERDGYALDYGVDACLLGSRRAIGSVLSRCEDSPDILPAGAAIYHRGEVLPFLGNNLLPLAGQKVLRASDLLRFAADSLRARGDASYETSVEQWEASGSPSTALRRVVRSLSVALLPTDRFDRASCGELFAFLRQVMRRMVAMGYPAGGWGKVLGALQALPSTLLREGASFPAGTPPR